jgi:hypothetical protein
MGMTNTRQMLKKGKWIFTDMKFVPMCMKLLNANLIIEVTVKIIDIVLLKAI